MEDPGEFLRPWVGGRWTKESFWKDQQSGPDPDPHPHPRRGTPHPPSSSLSPIFKKPQRPC